jgi:hypothetical protein
MSSPSLWRVSKPSIPADLRKFNDRLRDLPEAIRRRARSNSQQLDASKNSPVTLGGKVPSYTLFRSSSLELEMQ